MWHKLKSIKKITKYLHKIKNRNIMDEQSSPALRVDNFQLSIYINTNDQELTERYKIAAKKHNSDNHNIHYDSGFDVFMPNSIEVDKQYGYLVDTKIVCEMEDLSKYQYDNMSILKKTPRSFYLYPRSSLSKTPFRLANSVGIIDSGYRGNVKCIFDVFKDVKIDKYDRLMQICHPSLKPFSVNIVDKKFEETVRGDKGFGSSGK